MILYLHILIIPVNIIILVNLPNTVFYLFLFPWEMT